MWGTIKKYTIEFFLFVTRGAKVTAILEYGSMRKSPTDIIDARQGAIPISYKDDDPVYDKSDLFRLYTIRTYAILTLKNNSRYPAYNLTFKNAGDLFTLSTKLQPLQSLLPNALIQLELFFEDKIYHPINENLNVFTLSKIPQHSKDKILLIEYTNEAGTKLKTEFIVSFDTAINSFGTA